MLEPDQPTHDKAAEADLSVRIAQVDRLISAQLDAILHAPEFRKLEASWRGLRYLVDNTPTSEGLQIRVLNVSKKELQADFEKAPQFHQSSLFQKVYEEEFGIFGGSPFSVLLGDYEFSASTEDMKLLAKISAVAATSQAPFLAAASSAMFDLESFAQLNEPRELWKVFSTVKHARWNSFRESEASRYVVLTVPRILLRLPYGQHSAPVKEFDYEEAVNGGNHLWGNAAWALGARLTDAFASHGWCARIRGAKNGGLARGLPYTSFRIDDWGDVKNCPVENPMSDRREKELGDLGFAPLVHCRGENYAAFFSVNSVQKSARYDPAAPAENPRLSMQLPYILAGSRFAQYLKCMCRDRIGGYVSVDACERWLNSWIQQYVWTGDQPATADEEDAQAERPLRKASVAVQELPGKRGVFRAFLLLQPQFRFDETTTLRFVVDLPRPAS